MPTIGDKFKFRYAEKYCDERDKLWNMKCKMKFLEESLVD